MKNIYIIYVYVLGRIIYYFHEKEGNLKQYLHLLDHILKEGNDRGDRTGTGTRSVFGYQMRFDLRAGFPLLTTKKVHFKSIVHELLWFLKGDTNVAYLQEHGIRIWNEWADENGDLGHVYGKQWRSWEAPDGTKVDQIKYVIDLINNQPESRRILVNAWNSGELDKMALTPCHCLFQFYVENGHLSCQLYQRSADVFLGVPFNIASYSLLTHMIAQVCDLKPGEFIHTFGDVHLYANHFEQAKTQLQREPGSIPKLELNPAIKDIDLFKYQDIRLLGYEPAPGIRAPIAV